MAFDPTSIDIANYIDHSLLNPTATSEQIKQYCTEAEQFNFPSVCVYPGAVWQAADLLHGKPIKVGTVIGFPTGATTSATKLYEAQEAVENGATELDMVINLGWLKEGKTEDIYREIADICGATGQIVKVILEMNLLTETEKQLAAEIAMDAGAAYLKTSTGWFGGATTEDVSLLKTITKGRVGIKASGGIRTVQQALQLIDAGATRLGTSRGVSILQQRDNTSSSD
ncbi:MAG: deoxyribose-phosphate aldolase [Spirulinaceae cyanobacterium]